MYLETRTMEYEITVEAILFNGRVVAMYESGKMRSGEDPASRHIYRLTVKRSCPSELQEFLKAEYAAKSNASEFEFAIVDELPITDDELEHWRHKLYMDDDEWEERFM